ncbi:hypothetical protein [Pleomorphomonas carboxyditropha]|uniref:Uncharacterized protein n=1 Tax=Pleomorphomonas carboxyditropha TaxID=2023338 RepID=A0A2G9WTR2_9HYPH|nr:hypothetical protein [Pleomorphomonas carboxyditropha]PIO98106.1 hypothetical protein CJ014_17215 [Pleomorphomonas carboxyditropha]
MKPSRLSPGLCLFVPSTLISSALLAQDYKWPDKIPSESTELIPQAASPGVFKFTQNMIGRLKNGNDTAGLVMHAA